MLVICAKKAIVERYGAHDGAAVLAAAAALGEVVDVSEQSEHQIRKTLDNRKRELPACLIGDYGLVPTFRMNNPTRNASKEVDTEVLSDAPYGARSTSLAERFLPTRAVSRIPDSGNPDAAAFIALLQRAAAAPATSTPNGTFQQAAAEFKGSALLVHKALPGLTQPRLSPPDPEDMPTLGEMASGQGRLHILLHGSDRGEGRAKLWGRAAANSALLPTATASDLRGANLGGAIVSFSSCYSAMLDSRAGDGPRAPDNQVSLACLAAGAKIVYGATGANWIDITDPYDSFGSALIAYVWKRLHQGLPAAEALRSAKWDYSDFALKFDAWARPYVLKTLLQAQCYGNPLAKL